MLFEHLKRNLNFRRLRLRAMTGARDECTLAAIGDAARFAQNCTLRAMQMAFPLGSPLEKGIMTGKTIQIHDIDERLRKWTPSDRR